MDAQPAPPRLIPIEVEQVDDPRLADYHDIRERDARGTVTRPAVFVGEQFLIVEKMLALPGVTKSILIAPHLRERFRERFEFVDEGPADAIPLYVASPALVESIAGFAVHRGVLAVGRRAGIADRSIESALPDCGGTNPLTVLLCEEIRNIDNIGMLFRNAAAFGVDAVVLSPTCHDPLYRKSLRVSIGHVLTVPWVRSMDWATDLERLKREWNLMLIAASAGRGAPSLDSIAPPTRVGIVVGSEFDGVSQATLRGCDAMARIPMSPRVDSLNVATAAAVILHRFSRGERM